MTEKKCGVFTTRVVSRQECQYPQFLKCNHDCQSVIQLRNRISEDVEFELCVLEALHVANGLRQALAGPD